MQIKKFLSNNPSIFIGVVLFILCVTLGVLLFHPSYPGDKSPNATQTRQNFDSFTLTLFQNEVAANTLTLHYTVANPADYGILDYNISLGQYVINSATTKKDLSSLQEQLHKFNTSFFTSEQQLLYDLLDDFLKKQLALSDYTLYQEPLGPSLGIQAQLPVLLAEYDFRTLQDLEDYLNLLQAIPIYYENIIQFEQKKAKSGLFMCEATLDGILQQCQSFIEKPEESILVLQFPTQLNELIKQSGSNDLTNQTSTTADTSPVSTTADTSAVSAKTGFTKKQRKQYIAIQKQIVCDIVCPAYKNLMDSLEKLRPYCTENQGLAHYPDGKKYYSLLLCDTIGTNRTVEQIRHMISDSLKNAQSETATLILEHPELLEQNATPEVFPHKPEEILTVLSEQIKDDFPDCATSQFCVKYVDTALSNYLSPAFYLMPPIDQLQDNTIYINEPKIADSLSLFTTLAHEGFPGHLYQTTYFAATDPHPLRYLLSCPGYTEGWATYVELYSYSLTGLDEQMASLYANQYRYTLSLYCLADIGIHYDGWDFSQTCDFFAEYGITKTDAIRQIYDIILSEPGNYLTYYVGCLEFENLKEKCQEAWGDDFTLKRFHTAVLKCGPCPFSVLEHVLLDSDNTP